MKHFLHNSFLWAYWYPLRGLLNTLSAPLMYRFAAVLGDIHRFFSINKKECLAKEWRFLAKHHNPGEQLAPAVRGAFIHQLQNDAEMFRYYRMNRHNIDRYIICRGLEYLKGAVAEERGIILSFGHFGANKMIMAAVGHRGYPMNQFSTPPTIWKKKLIHQDMSGMTGRDLELREKADNYLPSKFINIFESLRPAYRCLKNHEILGVAIDGAGGQRKIELEWNGHRAVFSLGPMDLALRTNSIVLPVYTIREKGGRNVMIIEPRVSERYATDPAELTRAVVTRHAAQALTYPSFYLHFLAFRRHMDTVDDSGMFV